MEQVAEQLHALHQARARAREVRRRVHRHHAGAERGEPLALLHRLGRGLLGVVAAGHRHDHLGRERLELRPLRRARLLTGRAEHVQPARQLDHLRHPVAADVDRVEPLERRHARARRVLHRLLDRRDPRGGVLGKLLPGLLDAGRLREPRHVGEHLPEGGRVERDHLRLGGQPLGHGAHVVERHRADLADRLRHDQVHAELLERALVELVEGLAAPGALAHRGVDLGGRAGPRESRCG